MLKSRAGKVGLVLAGLAVAGQLSLIATAGKIGSLDLAKVPGCFVYLDDGELRTYCPRRGQVARKQHTSLESVAVLLAPSRTPGDIVFLGQGQSSGLLRVRNAGSEIGIFPDPRLGGHKPGNITRWRLGGNELYTIAEREGQAALFRLDMHGRLDSTKLPLPSGLKMQDEWSAAPSVHDGTKIVFSAPVEVGPWPILPADMSSGTVRTLAYGYHPEWSPDGSRIAFARGLHVGVLDVASGKTSRFTIWRPRTVLDYLVPIGTPAIVTRITWLGDSGYLACGVGQGKLWREWIVVVDLSTGATHQLPVSTAPAKWAWVPDAQR